MKVVVSIDSALRVVLQGAVGSLLRLDRVDIPRNGAIKGRDTKQVIRREAAGRVGLRITAGREVEAGGDVGSIGVVEWRIIRERGGRAQSVANRVTKPATRNCGRGIRNTGRRSGKIRGPGSS